jgi:drug/metabolite transporter (DMT)-like permease
MWSGIYVVVASMLWSTIGVATLLSSDVVLMLLVRSTIVALIGLLMCRSRSKASLVVGLILGILFTSYVVSITLAGVGPAAYLLYTAPIWSSIMALRYGERVGRYDFLGMVLVVVAVVLMTYDSVVNHTVSLYGIVSGLTSGFIYGLYISVVRYYSSRGLDKEVSIGAMPYIPLTVYPLTLYYVFRGFTPGNIYSSVIAGTYLAIFCTLIPYRLFTLGTRRLSASTASVIATIEPVFASIWDYLIFSKVPTTTLLTAYVLMVVALITVSVKSR